MEADERLVGGESVALFPLIKTKLFLIIALFTWCVISSCHFVGTVAYRLRLKAMFVCMEDSFLFIVKPALCNRDVHVNRSLLF